MIPGTWPALAGVLTLASCHVGLARPEDLPAVMTDPTAAARSEVSQAVSLALNGAVVTLADDALVHESTLIIEGARIRAVEGAPATGRETRKPQHFRLVRSGSTCVLIHQESARRFTLTQTACSAR